MENASRIVFTAASIVLMALAAGLTLFAGFEIFRATLTFQHFDTTLLNAIGYVVIAIAVFDVAKYLLEEEVLRGREMRNAGEARKSLTKFVSTIAIAVFLEALVTIFKVAKEDPEKLLFPTLLLLAGVAMIVGLGVFQRLSVKVEESRPDEKAKDEHAAAR